MPEELPPLEIFKSIIKLIYREGRIIRLGDPIREKIIMPNYYEMNTSFVSRKLNEIEKELSETEDIREIVDRYHDYVGLTLEDLESKFTRKKGAFGDRKWQEATRSLIQINNHLDRIEEETNKLLAFFHDQHPVLQSKSESLWPGNTNISWIPLTRGDFSQEVE